MANQPPRNQSDSILIVGAGVFGLTTALELHKRGYRNCTVLDRFFPPAPDGSSVDISRVVRSDYADPFYERMGREAIEGWETEYRQHFHKTGVVLLADKPGHPYLDRCKDVLKTQEIPHEVYADGNQVRQQHPVLQADLSNKCGYHNPLGGWADAHSAIQTLAQECTRAGVSFCTGARGTVAGLVQSGRKVTGVRVQSGAVVSADHVILATGAWTNQLLDLRNAAISTGQPLGFIQLTADEAEPLVNMPVCIDFSSGFFVFPPTRDTHVLKMARHGYGYEGAADQSPSFPKRDGNGALSGYIPDDAADSLRQGLAVLLPQFKNHPWSNRRLCWYTDTAAGDFIADHHPRIDGLFIATGGSGHAFKFLPVLGRYLVDCFENIASPELRKRWAWKPSGASIDGDGSRSGPRRRTLSPEERAHL